MKWSALLTGLMLLTGCTMAPRGIAPVENFELERYLGRWYEIARLDHRFERGLSRVTADYSRRPDGGIAVVNRGYHAGKGEWAEVRGRAYPLDSPAQGSLKVSFFWPFYAGYHVIALDRVNHGYALVCGPSRDYLWILARTPSLDAEITRQLIAQARLLGFVTDQLIFVDHD